MTQQKSSKSLEQAILDVRDNKYTLVIKAAVEAKKIKGEDKEKKNSWGKISLEALRKILIEKQKEKE